MELRNYARIIMRHWWLVAPLTLLALTVSLFLAFSQPLVFEASSSYVGRLETGTTSIGDTLYGLDTLTARANIFATYCEVFTSQSVREAAYQLIGSNIPKTELDKYTIDCAVIPSTNVLLLNVQGLSPTLVERISQSIGMVGMSRTNTLYRFFGLQPLDPTVTKQSTTAASRLQIGILGGILGLTIAVGLAFVLEYLRSPTERLEMLSIRDARLGVYNQRYFHQRLAEEINRSRVRHRPISVALLRLRPTEDFTLLPEGIQETALRSASLFMDDRMREVDIIASHGRYTYAVLLPETPATEARNVIANLHRALREQTFKTGDFAVAFTANSGLVESSGGIMDVTSMMSKATEALNAAETSGENTIELVRTSPMPFALDEEMAPQPEAEPMPVSSVFFNPEETPEQEK